VRGRQYVVGDLAGHPEHQRSDGRPPREGARRTLYARSQPSAERVRAVGFHADGQRNGGVQFEAARDARKRMHETVAAHAAEADPSRPDRHGRRSSDQEQRPAPHSTSHCSHPRPE
jgi:hypothetical protein